MPSLSPQKITDPSVTPLPRRILQILSFVHGHVAVLPFIKMSLHVRILKNFIAGLQHAICRTCTYRVSLHVPQITCYRLATKHFRTCRLATKYFKESVLAILATLCGSYDGALGAGPHNE